MATCESSSTCHANAIVVCLVHSYQVGCGICYETPFTRPLHPTEMIKAASIKILFGCTDYFVDFIYQESASIYYITSRYIRAGREKEKVINNVA